jgi:hypothetical protein
MPLPVGVQMARMLVVDEEPCQGADEGWSRLLVIDMGKAGAKALA